MNIGQIFLNIRLFFCLCWPATVFIGLCVGFFVAFLFFLSTIAQSGPLFVGGAWLLLFIFFMLFEVAFTLFAARRLYDAFGSEELRVQRRMASLSGCPFYVLCLLCFMMSLVGLLYSEVNAPTVFASLLGFVGFGFVSLSYLLLIRFFSGRSTAIAQQ